MASLISIIGIVGMIILLIAFALEMYNKIDKKKYRILNIVGSFLLLIYAIDNNSFPFIVLETAWIIVAIKK